VFDARGLAGQVDAIVDRAKAQLAAGPELRAQLSQRTAEMRARVAGSLAFVEARLAAARAEIQAPSRPT